MIAKYKVMEGMNMEFRYWTITINDRPVEQTFKLTRAVERARDYAYWNSNAVVAICLYKLLPSQLTQPARPIRD
jgi:hypothetical protein